MAAAILYPRNCLLEIVIAIMCDCLAAAFPYSMECMDVWKWERQHSNRMDLNAMYKQGEGRVDAAIQVWDTSYYM